MDLYDQGTVGTNFRQLYPSVTFKLMNFLGTFDLLLLQFRVKT